jgi:signal transduction histidine kinase
VYQWGGFEPEVGAQAVATVPLAVPLKGWKLEILLSDAAFTGRMGGGIRAALFSGIGGFALALLLLAVSLYRSSERARREALQRVTFVNQVSHELKTPLTNIRLYAELLEGRLDEAETKGRRDLEVIVSESQRLSRLIDNVLSFARQGRGELKLRFSQIAPDQVINEVLRQFAPALRGAGITVRSELDASEPLWIDPDGLGQMLANLISNVEKYAAGGGALRLRSNADGRRVTISVADDGPGIPKAFARRIFEPFGRAESALTEGVSGTGIGLALARDLARLHGGDLLLKQQDQGAFFELSLMGQEEA